MDIVVLCPTRGNPGALKEAFDSFTATAMERGSRFVAVVDETDPRMSEYFALSEDLEVVVVPAESCGNMNRALNWAASLWAINEAEVIIGFVGDDHRFRTNGWDRVISQVLGSARGGFAYGNDLYMGDYLPTQVFITSRIIAALGWMGLPGAKHLYLDNTWKTLGDFAGCLYYLPDIHIEHMHPAAGKGEWDEAHKRVNTNEMYAHDQAIYNSWVRDQSETDAATVRGVIEA